MPTCKEIYCQLNSKCEEIILKTFIEDTRGLQSKSHSFLLDFTSWTKVLESRPENLLLDSAIREYQFGLLAVVQGQYRQAYMALRLFLEQSLAAVYFSSNELQLRLWMQEKQDIFWQNILDPNNGVFSHLFVGAFFPTLSNNASIYREMAKNVYRECSLFTHGNFVTHEKSKLLHYNKELFEDWHEKAETSRIIVMFALCLRYLYSMDTRMKRELIESSIMDYIGHISAVRAFFEINEAGEIID